MTVSSTRQGNHAAPAPEGETTGRRLFIAEGQYPGLDPAWVRMWNEHGSAMVRADEVTLEEYHRDPAKYSFTYPTYPGPDVHAVEDRDVPVTRPAGTVAVRIYTPEGSGPFPVHLNFHGGGWVLGGLGSEAAWCRHMCNEAGIKVIDVDYRMGPEYKFPTAIYDCWDAVKWTREHAAALNVNPESISIGGLSAGGQMSAVLAHFARDEGIPLRLQLMVVPATDMRYCRRRLTQLDEVTCPYLSARDLRYIPWSPLSREQWFLKYWLGDDDDVQEEILNNWICTPVLAPSFQNLARAHIITAEFDVERDEGEYYGKLLRAGGNEVTAKRYLGVPHAFGHYNHPERGLKQSFEYIKDTSELLREVHFGVGGKTIR
ncbi:Alpha/Beta hydrolase protein [Plectosphaerella plurivora]|uniref:Alpha/Beta hydrolase protein n=1 Tax=Plectosphaerella plurivora TaxID=936078 RepID=A0A9P8VM19_9PEZI|nr:Alpha/Beta hydrolase protein [Plectosphaerella plurivora]